MHVSLLPLALPWVVTTHPPCQSLFVHLSLLIGNTTSVAINCGHDDVDHARQISRSCG